jgi:hypothetical protein
MAAALPLPLCVKMKGLPFKACPEDITRFFAGFNLRPDSIFLKRHPDGRPNGEVRGAVGGAVGVAPALQTLAARGCQQCMPLASGAGNGAAGALWPSARLCRACGCEALAPGPSWTHAPRPPPSCAGVRAV